VLPARRPFPPGGPTCDRWHTTLPVSSPLIQQLISGPDDTPAHTGPPVMHARDLAQKKKAADQVHLNPGEDTAAATRLPSLPVVSRISWAPYASLGCAGARVHVASRGRRRRAFSGGASTTPPSPAHSSGEATSKRALRIFYRSISLSLSAPFQSLFPYRSRI
jgi:hypothetical protein